MDLKIKEPVMYDAIRLATQDPEIVAKYNEFGIYEKVEVN